MTVLHFSSAKSWRGGEQQIAYLVKELRKISVKQIILCVKDSAIADFCTKENIFFIPYKKRAAISLAPGFLLSKTIKKHQVDLVHLHDAHAHTFACLGASFFNIKTPFVLSRRVDFPIKKNRFSLWKYNHPNIQAILCVSAFIKKVIENDIRMSSKIEVVHSGIDPSKFHFDNKNILRKEFDIPLQSPLIANVAAIAPHKDYFTFVDTATIILQSKPTARFLMIGGDGGEQKKVQQYIEERQLSRNIQFTGFRKDIPEILPEIDVFLFTSKEEGLGTSLLDAQASKLPIVATRAGGAPEIIQHEVTGLTAAVGDAKQLAHHVLTFLNNDSLKDKLVQNGLQKLSSFTTLETARKTLNIYKKTLNK